MWIFPIRLIGGRTWLGFLPVLGLGLLGLSRFFPMVFWGPFGWLGGFSAILRLSAVWALCASRIAWVRPAWIIQDVTRVETRTRVQVSMVSSSNVDKSLELLISRRIISLTPACSSCCLNCAIWVVSFSPRWRRIIWLVFSSISAFSCSVHKLQNAWATRPEISWPVIVLRRVIWLRFRRVGDHRDAIAEYILDNVRRPTGWVGGRQSCHGLVKAVNSLDRR